MRSTLQVLARHGGVAMLAAIWGTNGNTTASATVYLRNTLWQNGYVADTVETACDWPKVKPMMTALEQAATDALAQFEGVKVHTYTHLSHIYAQGSSVYTTFAYRQTGDYDKDLARWQAHETAVCQAIVAITVAPSATSMAWGWTMRLSGRRKRAHWACRPCAACSSISTPGHHEPRQAAGAGMRPCMNRQTQLPTRWKPASAFCSVSPARVLRLVRSRTR
jgi:hypothetical protein